MDKLNDINSGIVALVKIMQQLRSEKGCPWDKVQTHATLKPYIIEETYEVIDAIDNQDSKALKEELGDLLFQIIFHCQLAEERGEFNINDVCRFIQDKMIRRHPHVFADMTFETPSEVSRQWEERKKEEGKNKDSIFDGIPKHLPSLLMAQRVQSRANKVGFDWDNIGDVISKLKEEIQEFEKVLKEGNKQRCEDEIGDMLFSIVNISRHLKINAEDALRRCVKKFITRFAEIEKHAKQHGKKLSDMTLDEMDEIWQRAKEGEGD
ncbi:MAG: nucleoside triphosphate pyrophosphohydrolase [Thermodesulfovibrionales bacterium]|nr:nucleoside triphosphate pyrophosphohydrolase [Thermodesulfovibrionales bacterium]